MSDLFIPKNPVNVAIRPLDKGIILNSPSTMLPAGAFTDAQNVWVIDGTLKRRPGITPYIQNGQMSYPVRGAATLWSVGGSIYNVHWDKRYVYAAATSNYVPRYWVYTTGTVRYTTGKYTLFALSAGTAWTAPTNMLRVGDVISIGGLGRYTISLLQAATQLVMATSFPSTGGPTSYTIIRAFQNTDSRLIDYCIADNTILFADGGRPLYSYNGSTFGRYMTNPVTDSGSTVFNWRPYCVASFANRIWVGNTVEAGYHRQRVRWSQVTDHEDFRDASGNDTQWLDLPYSPGQIRKLLPLGNMLMCYLDDCIYNGMQTNIPTLPVTFQKIDTGGIGLVGCKAITSYMGSHFFIGQDDIYAVQSKGIERIGTPVVRETIRTCTELTFCQCIPDPINDRIVFGFPESATNMVRLWSYFYKTKAWTYDEINASSIDFLLNATNVTWDNFNTFSSDGYWSGIEFSAWDAIKGTGSVTGYVIFGQSNGRTFTFSTDGSVDNTGAATSPIPVVIESGDIDLDAPDDEKTWLRLGLKLRDIATEDIVFTIEVNQFRDRATTWKNVGTMTIATGDDESYVNFRLTSSQCRFRISSNSTVAPYAIQEIVLRVREAGQETRRVAS